MSRSLFRNKLLYQERSGIILSFQDSGNPEQLVGLQRKTPTGMIFDISDGFLQQTGIAGGIAGVAWLQAPLPCLDGRGIFLNNGAVAGIDYFQFVDTVKGKRK